MKESKLVNSLIKGLNILEIFTPSQHSLSFKEVGIKTGLPKTTVFRFLRTLTSHEYLSLDPRSKKYYLGPRVLSLGFTVLSSMDLKEVALPHLEELARTSDQNVTLAILDNKDVVIIERIRKYQMLDFNLPIGGRLNCYQSAMGRAILAFSNQEKLRHVLGSLLKDKAVAKRIGPKGGKLLKILKEARRNGYATCNEEYLKGVRSVAAPIFNAKGEVEGAVHLPVFSQTVSQGELIERYVPLLMATARKISEARGQPR